MSNKQTLFTPMLAAAALLLAGVPDAAAQEQPLALRGPAAAAASNGGAERAAAVRDDHWTAAADKYDVLIDLDENRLHFRQGGVTLWSAPVGTGTGLRLETDDQEWDFSTPNGTFEVKFKERNPVWRAPDWFYVENDLPIPPKDSPKRLFPGGLGAAAVYIDAELAIHGTDKPELLGQRVSHGCIRLSDRDARRLFHNVQIGTPVRIVGGRDVRPRSQDGAAGSDASTFTPDQPKKPKKDPVLERWKRMTTSELLDELDLEVWADEEHTRWTEIAGLLVERGLDDGDDAALAGLLRRTADLPTQRVEREFATFVADAYGRGAARTLRALGQLDEDARRHAARAIVTATAGLYPGGLSQPTTPWPTGRLPESLVRADLRRGWDALAEAEAALRAANWE